MMSLILSSLPAVAAVATIKAAFFLGDTNRQVNILKHSLPQLNRTRYA